MKKEEIYVSITSEEDRLRVVDILGKAGEDIVNGSSLLNEFNNEMRLFFDNESSEWKIAFYKKERTQITIDKLEALLIPNYVVKDVALSFDELKAQAEKLGYDLVEKPYKPKVGDFGGFYDSWDKSFSLGFITEISDHRHFTFNKDGVEWWENFRKLTEEEKSKIQASW